MFRTFNLSLYLACVFLVSPLAVASETLSDRSRLELETMIEEAWQYHKTHHGQNNLEKDHGFIGAMLEKFETILDRLISEDPFFRALIKSPEYQNQWGLILTRVVWQSELGRDISGETVQLKNYSPFADPSKAPMLIKLTPLAFTSLPFLRSILLHELNHVCFFKDPRFSDPRRFQGAALQSSKGVMRHYFSRLDPRDPSYQFYLIHEYYSFKSQLLFDEQMEPIFRLDPLSKARFEKMMEWTYAQMNAPNQKFVKLNPLPPISVQLRWFYRK